MEKEKLANLLKRSSKVVGSKQVLKGISDGTIRCVIVATDADAELKRKLIGAAGAKGITVEKMSSKRRLGELAGVEVAAAAVGIIKAEAID